MSKWMPSNRAPGMTDALYSITASTMASAMLRAQCVGGIAVACVQPHAVTTAFGDQGGPLCRIGQPPPAWRGVGSNENTGDVDVVSLANIEEEAAFVRLVEQQRRGPCPE